MFVNNLKAIFAAACFSLMTGCGGGSSDESSVPGTSDSAEVTTDAQLNPDTGSNPTAISGELPSGAWAINEFIFEPNGGSSSQTGEGDFVVTNISTTGLETENGAFAGSSITIVGRRLGEGIYSLLDSPEILIDFFNNSPDTLVAHITVSAGTANEPASMNWSSVTGIIEVTVDDNGVFSYSSIEPLVPDQVTVIFSDISPN